MLFKFLGWILSMEENLDLIDAEICGEILDYNSLRSLPCGFSITASLIIPVHETPLSIFGSLMCHYCVGLFPGVGINGIAHLLVNLLVTFRFS